MVRDKFLLLEAYLLFELYAAIWRVSGRRQILLIVMSLVVAALAAVPLKYQKDIVNGLTHTGLDHWGLYRLCGEMFAMILLSLCIKWLVGYRSNLLGEDVVRLLRVQIYCDAIKVGPEGHARVGTLATMIAAEAEEVGRFAGNAISEPVVQIGTLVTVVGFIAATQPYLGTIALAMIIPQVALVLATQGRVNKLVGERVHVLRHATDMSVATGLTKINQEVLNDFDTIFEKRRKIFIWKLSTKFVLSAINGAGMVGVLALGGALVIADRTDVGTVVAATIGLGRLQGPTGFLVAFYRTVSATQIKFELLRGFRLEEHRPTT